MITLDLLRKAPSTFNYFIMFSATIAGSNFYQTHVGLKKFYSYPFNGDRLRNLRCILLMSSGAVSHFSKNSHMNAITQVRVKAKFISRKRANSILLIENELTPELSIWSKWFQIFCFRSYWKHAVIFSYNFWIFY